jgi:PatG Domain
MEQNEVNEPSTNQDMARSASITPAQGEVMDSPPAQEMPCPTCAGAAASMPMSYIYALGRIETRFPRLSVEKEFAQVTGRAETVGKTDQQVFHGVLSKPENRYLARQMCWVLTIQGLETYILQPRDPVDFNQLVEAIRPVPSPNDIDIVVGMRGPIAPPEMCNGLMVPIVGFDQIYSFNRDALIRNIPLLGKNIDKADIIQIN